MNNEKNNAYRFRMKRWSSAILETHTKNTDSHTNYVDRGQTRSGSHGMEGVENGLKYRGLRRCYLGS